MQLFGLVVWSVICFHHRLRKDNLLGGRSFPNGLLIYSNGTEHMMNEIRTSSWYNGSSEGWISPKNPNIPKDIIYGLIGFIMKNSARRSFISAKIHHGFVMARVSPYFPWPWLGLSQDVPKWWPFPLQIDSLSSHHSVGGNEYTELIRSD